MKETIKDLLLQIIERLEKLERKVGQKKEDVVYKTIERVYSGRIDCPVRRVAPARLTVFKILTFN